MERIDANHSENSAAPMSGDTRDTWVKPEIVFFDVVPTTEANTINPGDALSSNS
ncbi:hypothetical protein [Sphingomonas sp.]|uniref:hypothetical protein n=1 Tax=Sphingomonas sp. TaxID=28214 RepID=UPI003D6D8609